MSSANLEKAHAIVCKEYERFRATGGAASSPYLFYLMHQSAVRRLFRAKGRGDYELYEMQFTGVDGKRTTVDLRELAPDVFEDVPQ